MVISPPSAPARQESAEQAPSGLCARDIMSQPAVTIDYDASLLEAIALMQQSRVRHLVVTDGPRCAGILDDRRLLVEWGLGPRSEGRRRVRDLIARHVRCVLVDTDLMAIGRILLHEDRGAVPVVSPEGDVIGIVTASDVLRALVPVG